MTYNVVGAVIINNNNEVLVARRAAFKPNPGYFEFPGGKVEVDETNQEALQRELFEEMDIEIEVLDIIASTYFQYDTFDVNLNFYAARILNGEIVLKDHSEIRWFNFEQLLECEMLESNKPILNMVGEYIERIK